VRVTTRQLSGAWLQSSAAQMLGTNSTPVFEGLKQGQWKGWIAFNREGDLPGVWSGDYELQNASIDVPGLALPVRLASAAVKMTGGQVQVQRIRGRAGKIAWEGDYRYDPNAPRPHKLRISAAEVQLTDLEQLMLPTLRRDEGFFARAFRRPATPQPKWLEDRKLDATIQIASLLAPDAPLGRVRTHLLWDGTSLDFNTVDCRLDRMHFTGKIALNVSGATPRYHVDASVENLEYRNGQLDVDGTVDTSGIGADLLLNARSDGTFTGRGIAWNAEALMRDISGSYRMETVAGIPRLTLSNVEATEGPEVLTGQGVSQPDGRLVLDLRCLREPRELPEALAAFSAAAPGD